MANVVILTGRIATDLVMGYTQDNVSKLNFNLAVRHEYKTNGEYGTSFFRCVCWRKLAERVAQYKDKGDWIEVVGQLQSRSYKLPSGEDRWITEVMCRNVNFPLIGEHRNDKPAVIDKQEEPDVSHQFDEHDDLPF
jgi:single-strand DNA-binding protein